MNLDIPRQRAEIVERRRYAPREIARIFSTPRETHAGATHTKLACKKKPRKEGNPSCH